MPLHRVQFTIGRMMSAVAIFAVACKVISELIGMGTPSRWFVGLLVMVFGYYLLSAFVYGFVLDLIAALISRVNRLSDDAAGPPCRTPDLYEPCQLMITQSRRSRASRDAEWISTMADLSRADRYCRSLLEEATVRLATRENHLSVQVKPAVEEIPLLNTQPPDM